MSKKKQRRAPTLKERLTPCITCGHPLSQKHHLLSFSIHGDEGVGTIQLCANCHDLYHLFERYEIKKLKSREESIVLFKAQSFEDELLGQLARRLECRMLAQLASVVASTYTLMSRDPLSEEDRTQIHLGLNFIADFKQYARQEQDRFHRFFNSTGTEMFFHNILDIKEG